ncbi:DUF4126 domain-containing protein [Deinococcus sonorensis]|uniref:DUF4126 domain-containing protein n=2 Tax=Deinococcus sonorensis TaxID=309891 RepID=A0AAU7UBE4_9DEIO
MDLLTNALSGLGLSGAAGLNAYIPLLLVGLLDRLGLLHLAGPFAWLSSPWVLLGIVVLGLLDFVGDKIPGVDHVLHLAGGVVNVAAGGVLFASQHGAATGLNPTLALVLGLLVSGGVHATRTVLRPAATTLTAGVGNPVVSSIEDGLSLLLSVLAVLFPLLAVVVLALLVWQAWRLLGRVRYRLSGRSRI